MSRHKEPVNEDKYIKFDVNGALFECHRSTISNFPDSRLAKALESRSKANDEPDNDHMVFHRDDTYFGEILNFMRNRTSLDLSQWRKKEIESLRIEADYYRIAPLVEFCEEKLAEYGLDYDPKFGAFDINSFEVFVDPEELEEHLETRSKPAYLISSRVFMAHQTRKHLVELTEYLDSNLLEVYGFLGTFPNSAASSGAILYDTFRSRIAFSIPDTDTNLNVHYPIILFIQKELNTGSSTTDIAHKWPEFWKSLTKYAGK